MQNKEQVVYTSLASTGRHPRWWILALVQAAGFVAVGKLSKPDLVCLYWLVVALAVLAPLTTWLWCDMAAQTEKELSRLSLRNFLKNSLTAGAIMLVAVAVSVLARFLFLNWVFLSVLSSIIAATAALAMLYAVLFRQSFANSIALAFDTWAHKISLAAVAALILMMAHSISYVLAHAFLNNLRPLWEFSVLSHSATIWILFLPLAFFVGFFSAFFNCLLVLLFLNMVNSGKGKKEEAEEVVLKSPLLV